MDAWGVRKLDYNTRELERVQVASRSLLLTSLRLVLFCLSGSTMGISISGQALSP